jgi:hypothetical protein
MARPRNDRGWKPLPQKQCLLDAKVVLRAMTRYRVSSICYPVSLLAPPPSPQPEPFPAAEDIRPIIRRQAGDRHVELGGQLDG